MAEAYPKLNGCGEVVEVATNLLLQGLAALLVRSEVHEGRRNDALLALDSADDLVGELIASVRHR